MTSEQISAFYEPGNVSYIFFLISFNPQNNTMIQAHYYSHSANGRLKHTDI